MEIRSETVKCIFSKNSKEIFVYIKAGVTLFDHSIDTVQIKCFRPFVEPFPNSALFFCVRIESSPFNYTKSSVHHKQFVESTKQPLCGMYYGVDSSHADTQHVRKLSYFDTPISA